MPPGEDIFGSDANLLLNPPSQVQVTLTRAGSGPAPDAGDPRIVQLAIRASF